MTRVFVWQWGRRGAGPRFALEMAQAIQALPGHAVLLSLSSRAEILATRPMPAVPLCLVDTYGDVRGLVRRIFTAPLLLGQLFARLKKWKPDFAICAMTSPLDLLLVPVLKLLRVPFAVVVHDAVAHPGDGFPLQLRLQRLLIRQAGALVALTDHVAVQLGQQEAARGRALVRSFLPPFNYAGRVAEAGEDAGRSAGPLRLLMFGRLLAYKGLDLLADALMRLPADAVFECRIVGKGPDSEVLRHLATLPRVQVENRWVPEDEIGTLVEWSDVVVLPYREASQSGVGAVAIAAGRWIVSTKVGGLAEQFRGQEHAVLCAPEAMELARALERLIAAQPLPLIVPQDRGAELWTDMASRLVADLEHAFRLRT